VPIESKFDNIVTCGGCQCSQYMARGHTASALVSSLFGASHLQWTLSVGSIPEKASKCFQHLKELKFWCSTCRADFGSHHHCMVTSFPCGCTDIRIELLSTTLLSQTLVSTKCAFFVDWCFQESSEQSMGFLTCRVGISAVLFYAYRRDPNQGGYALRRRRLWHVDFNVPLITSKYSSWLQTCGCQWWPSVLLASPTSHELALLFGAAEAAICAELEIGKRV
jgi:hypothetical protein